MTRIALLVIACSTLLACGGSDEETGSGEGSGESLQPFRIESVGLTVDMPAGASLFPETDNVVTGGGYSVVVHRPEADSPETLESARASAIENCLGLGPPIPGFDENRERGERRCVPSNFEEETLADGWLLTHQTEGGLVDGVPGTGGTTYSVQARREIGGVTVMCMTVQTEETLAERAAAACRSLRPSSR